MSYLEQIKCCIDNIIYKLSIINWSDAPDPDVKESRSETQLKSFIQYGNLLNRSSEDSLRKLVLAPKRVPVTQTFHQAWGMFTVLLLTMNVQTGQFAQQDSLPLSKEKAYDLRPTSFFCVEVGTIEWFLQTNFLVHHLGSGYSHGYIKE